LQGVDNSNISNFKAPTFNGFRILNGPSNPAVSGLLTVKCQLLFLLHYILMPTSIGKFKIGSAQITQAGKTYTSNDLALKLLKAILKNVAEVPMTEVTKILAKAYLFLQYLTKYRL
jgi:hypothetical protein